MDSIFPDLYQGDLIDCVRVGNGEQAPYGEGDFALVVSVCECPYDLPARIDHLKVPIHDMKPGIGPYLQEITDRVWYYLLRRKPVLVHCFAGVSRSTAALVACLIRAGFGLDQALVWVKERRAVAEMNSCFLTELQAWETVCRGKTLELPPVNASVWEGLIPYRELFLRVQGN